MAAAYPDPEVDSPPISPIENLDQLDSEIESIMKNQITELDQTDDYIKKNKESIAKSQESLKQLKETMAALINSTTDRQKDLERRSTEMNELKKVMEEVSMDDIEREEEELKNLSVALTNMIPAEGENKENGPGNNDPEIMNSESGHSQSVEEVVSVTENSDIVTVINGLSTSLDIELLKANQDLIQVKFNNVNGCEDGQLHKVAFTLDGSNEYQYLDCQPYVEDIEAMFTALNKHRNLKCFMRSLRSEFQKLPTNASNGSDV